MSKKRTAVLEDLLDGLVESRAPTSQARRKVRNEEKAIRAAIGEAKRKQKIQLEEDFMPLEEKRKLKRIANIMKRVLKRVKDNSKKGKKYKVADIDQVVRLAKDNELLDEDAEAIAKMILNIPYMSSSNTLFLKGKAESKLNDALNNLFVEADEFDNLPRDIDLLKDDMSKDDLKLFLIDRGVKEETISNMSKTKLNDLATRILVIKHRQREKEDPSKLYSNIEEKFDRRTGMKGFKRNSRITELDPKETTKRQIALYSIDATRGNTSKREMVSRLTNLLGPTYDGQEIADMDYHTELKPLFNRIKSGKLNDSSAIQRYTTLSRMGKLERENERKAAKMAKQNVFDRLRNRIEPRKDSEQASKDISQGLQVLNPIRSPQIKKKKERDRSAIAMEQFRELQRKLRLAKLSKKRGKEKAPELRRQSALSKAIDDAADLMERLEAPTDGTLTQRGPDGEYEARPEGEAGEDFGKGGEAAARAARAAQERAEQEQEAAQGQSSSGASESKTTEDGQVGGLGVGLSKRLDTLISWLDSRLKSL